MKSPTNSEKVKIYEQFLHKINMMLACCNNEGVKELINNANQWSYYHRTGNGELTEKEQQQLINKAFWRLCETPSTDILNLKRQQQYDRYKCSNNTS